MLWILRRTRLTSAVAFFNTINNNNANNNAATENRPARKEYSRLPGEDTTVPATINLDSASHQEQLDNGKTDTEVVYQHDGCCHLTAGTKVCPRYHNRNDRHRHHRNCTQHRNNRNTDPDFMDTDTDSSFTDLDYDDKDTYSDDSDYDESLTCNVCDRAFPCHRQLSSHKQKKRHFGCSACDSLFPSLMALEHHKEEFEHWSGDEVDTACSDSDDPDTTSEIAEEMERLL